MISERLLSFRDYEVLIIDENISQPEYDYRM